MKKKHYIIIVSIAALVIAFMIFRPGKTIELKQLLVEVERGEFEILVTTTGELQAKSSVDIMGPSELRNSRSLRIREVKIKDLVAEGTVVDSGDYVGELDQTELGTSLKDLEDELETSGSQFLKTQLDTTMQLRELRDQLVNLKFTLSVTTVLIMLATRSLSRQRLSVLI